MRRFPRHVRFILDQVFLIMKGKIPSMGGSCHRMGWPRSGSPHAVLATVIRVSGNRAASHLDLGSKHFPQIVSARQAGRQAGTSRTPPPEWSIGVAQHRQWVKDAESVRSDVFVGAAVLVASDRPCWWMARPVPEEEVAAAATASALQSRSSHGYGTDAKWFLYLLCRKSKSLGKTVTDYGLSQARCWSSRWILR